MGVYSWFVLALFLVAALATDNRVILRTLSHDCCSGTCSEDKLQLLSDQLSLYAITPGYDEELVSLANKVLGGQYRCAPPQQEDSTPHLKSSFEPVAAVEDYVHPWCTPNGYTSPQGVNWNFMNLANISVFSENHTNTLNICGFQDTACGDDAVVCQYAPNVGRYYSLGSRNSLSFPYPGVRSLSMIFSNGTPCPKAGVNVTRSVNLTFVCSQSPYITPYINISETSSFSCNYQGVVVVPSYMCVNVSSNSTTTGGSTTGQATTTSSSTTGGPGYNSMEINCPSIINATSSAYVNITCYIRAISRSPITAVGIAGINVDTGNYAHNWTTFNSTNVYSYYGSLSIIIHAPGTSIINVYGNFVNYDKETIGSNSINVTISRHSSAGITINCPTTALISQGQNWFTCSVSVFASEGISFLYSNATFANQYLACSSSDWWNFNGSCTASWNWNSTVTSYNYSVTFVLPSPYQSGVAVVNAAAITNGYDRSFSVQAYVTIVTNGSSTPVVNLNYMHVPSVLYGNQTTSFSIFYSLSSNFIMEYVYISFRSGSDLLGGAVSNPYSYNVTANTTIHSLPNPPTGRYCALITVYGAGVSVNLTGPCIDVVRSTCEAGFYAKSSNGTGYQCVPCPRGTYSPTDGSMTCLPCPSGYTSSCVLASTSCVPCPAGYFTQDGQCARCPSGTYSTPGSAVCTPCNPGQYSSNPGSASCTLCAGGTSSCAGSSNCTVCPGGTYSNYGAPVCLSCAEGYYSNAGSTYCRPCPANTYSDTRSANCIPCPPGQTSPPGSFTCF